MTYVMRRVTGLVETVSNPVLAGIVLGESANGEPLHVQVKRVLHRAIDEHFPDGELFFKEMELVSQLGVSRPTVRQALQALETQGLIRRSKGHGTVVVKRSSSSASITQVAAVIHTYESEYLNTLLEHISGVCSHHKLHFHVCRQSTAKDMETDYLPFLRSPREEGILLLGSGSVLGKRFVKLGYRCVALSPHTLDSTVPSVETDAFEAVRLGLTYLRRMGHRRIALLVTEPSGRPSVQQKIEAFSRITADDPDWFDVSCRVVECDVPKRSHSLERGYRTMEIAWSTIQERRPTAVFTVSDYGAFGVLQWCADQGIVVPRDLSLLGFEGVSSGRLAQPPLTSVAHPVQEQAQKLVEMLLCGSQDSASLTPHLILRKSVGKPP